MKEFEVSHSKILINKNEIKSEFEILPFSFEIKEISFYSPSLPIKVAVDGLVTPFTFKNKKIVVEISKRKQFNLLVIVGTAASTIPNTTSTISSTTSTISSTILDYRKIPHFVNEKYPIDFNIVSRRNVMVICVGELVGKYLYEEGLLWIYRVKTAVDFKSVVVVEGIP
jgi:hypothetical protein